MIPWWRWVITAMLVVAALGSANAVLAVSRDGLPLSEHGRRAMAWAARAMAMLQVSVAGMVLATTPAAIPALVACALWLLVLAERQAPTRPGEAVRRALTPRAVRERRRR